MSLLQVKNLSKSFSEGQSKNMVLNEVNLDLAPGEIIAILSRSGSGKTTLLNLISGLIKPDKGSISIDGTEINSLTANQTAEFRRQNLGFIFQFFNLVPTLKVIENIYLPLELNKKLNSENKLLAEKMMERLEINSLKNRYPQDLSGGEKQRVAIIRAVIHQPKLILADEPTGNLDLKSSEKVSQLLFDICAETNTSLILVTHDQSLAKRTNRIYQLSNHQLKLI